MLTAIHQVYVPRDFLSTDVLALPRLDILNKHNMNPDIVCNCFIMKIIISHENGNVNDIVH